MRGFTDGQLAPVVASDEDEEECKYDDIPQRSFFLYGIVDF